MNRPRTRPTGRPPAAARRSPAAAPDAGVGLSAEAAALKACYAGERARWESIKAGRPVAYRPPAAYDGRPAVTIDGDVALGKATESEWARLARWCAGHGVHPESYVRLLFALVEPTRDRPPEPAQLRSEGALARWREGEGQLATRARAAYAVQFEAAKTHVAALRAVGVPAADAYAHVLMNDTVPLSPLFRHGLARQIKGPRFDRIAEFWESRAILQFGRYPRQYREEWGPILPEGFPERALRLYGPLLARGG